MSSQRPSRSASVGALPREKKHFTSRNESASGVSLDVRCACQFFESDSLLPERINPIGSRPESKVGFVADLGPTLTSGTGGAGVPALHLENVSIHSFAGATLPRHPEADRLSTRSFGGQRSFDQISNRSFGRELNSADAMGRRGLVVRSISDATEGDVRPRQVSVDRMSNQSFGMHDPDTISMRSGVSLRRISRSPSKQDLYVADINIPTTRSRMDIPQFNVIAPTPSPGVAQMRPDFSVMNKENFAHYTASRHVMPQNSPINMASLGKDLPPSPMPYTPLPLDQSQPPEGLHVHDDIVEQMDRPVLQTEVPDLSPKFEMQTEIAIEMIGPVEPMLEEIQLPPAQMQLKRQHAQERDLSPEIKRRDRERSPSPSMLISAEMSAARQRSPSPARFGNQREHLMPQNQPIDVGRLENSASLQPQRSLSPARAQQPTAINEREPSPSRFMSLIKGKNGSDPLPRSLSPPRTDLGDIPQRDTSPSRLMSLRKGNNGKDPVPHSLSPPRDFNEREPSPSRLLSFIRGKNGNDNLRQRSPSPAKIRQQLPDPEYQQPEVTPQPSRFGALFKSKTTRERSPSPMRPPVGIRERSPSPLKQIFMAKGNNGNNREASPSMMSKLRMSKAEPVENSSVMMVTSQKSNKSEQMMSVKVVETFSLKVDDMDQYIGKPKTTNQPSSKSPQRLEQSTSDIPQAQQSLMAGIRGQSLRLSQPDVSTCVTPMAPHHSQLPSHKKLVSVSTGLTDSEYGDETTSEMFFEENRSVDFKDAFQPIITRSASVQPEVPEKITPRMPSEQKLMQSNLLRKKHYLDGRTHSQDRGSAYNDSQSDAGSLRMSKTVSFDFGGHHSRLTDHSLEQQDKSDWIHRTYFSRDHEYEPIGVPQPSDDAIRASSKEPSPALKLNIPEPMETEETVEQEEPTTPDEMKEAEELQRDLEERYFSSSTTTPRTESRTDNEIHTSQVDSSALEELPLRAEDRKKSFMASAQDRGRKVQAGIRTQAGKIRTKIRGMKKPPRSPKSSPKAKDRKRFKAPEFAKMKMPEIKRPEMPKFKAPDMSKLKDFKRPEFTKFNKPDMSKFKIPEKFSSLKITRSKSFKEPSEVTSTEGASEETPESTKVTSPKKKFDFSSFGTYPRALRRGKSKQDSIEVNVPSVVTTETAPSVESTTTIPQGDRGPGPVRSRWADKFSDVSYGGSDTSRFQRFGSEQESFDRESSMERRMKDDLDSAAREQAELGIIGGAEQKEFAEFDEENRAIHEISQYRAGEFRRRPLVHQDSDLVSEESKDIGWSEKDIIKNKILRKTEFDTEGYNLYPSEEGSVNTNQETQSAGSSIARKGVIEEIDDDEFFLRKRGISQDNIEIRQYISSAIREGFETPVNALSQLGSSQPEYSGASNDPIDYGYDVPPPKPRRVKHYNNFDSQEFEQKMEYDDNISLPQPGMDYYRNIPPSRPLRKSHKYSESSHDHDVPDDTGSYFDNVEQDFYKKEHEIHYEIKDRELEDLPEVKVSAPPPKVPKRRRRSVRDTQSMDKDSFINGFGGRSVSNTYLQNDNQPDNVIVYRTEHVIPLATPERFTDVTSTPRKSRSHSHLDDDRTSRGADSLRSEAVHAEEKENDDQENYTIDMTEHDGYAVVRKDHPIPKPTPPARRKRFVRTPGERFATMPHRRTHSPHHDDLPDRPTRNYSTIGPSKPPRRKSSLSLGEAQKNFSTPDVSQYEELQFPEELHERAESPRDLQSGDVVNKMKFRPLPAPPRPPRDKKSRDMQPGDDQDEFDDKDDRDGGGERIAAVEVEVSTQTDPLPDDFVCEEFEITDDMRVIEPRRTRTVEDILREEEEAELARVQQQIDEENLSNGIYRFRESNQRSYSERSRASSQADRSKSLSRPQTPSAIVIEKRIPTPIQIGSDGIMLEASLTVHPLDDLEAEEELLRQEGLYEEGSVTKSDVESRDLEEEQRLTTTDHSAEPSVRDETERESELEESRPETEDEEGKVESSTVPTDAEEDEEEWERQLRLAEERLRLELPMSEDDKLKEISEAEDEMEMIPPPVPPPRKRSSLAGLEEASRDQTLEKSLTPLVEQPPRAVEPTLPARLALADLEVERLRVHALQAGHIMVSELHGAQISADELQCRSGNLVVRNIELPPGFIEEIVERVRTSERDHAQIPVETQTIETGERIAVTHSEECYAKETQTSQDAPPIPPPPQAPLPTTESTPMRPPPPEYVDSMPPASFYQLRNPDEPLPPNRSQFPEYLQSIPPAAFFQLRNPDEDEDYQPSTQTHRRRRHHRRRDSSSEESRRHRSRSRPEEQSVVQASRNLMSACNSSLARHMTSLANYLRMSGKQDGDSNVGTLVAIFIFMTLGFLLLVLSGKDIHHHHWDFFNPPDNGGRT